MGKGGMAVMETTTSHFHKKIQEVKQEMLKMGGLVEEAIHDSALALARRDAVLARRVVEGDRAIDALQNYVEERCVTLMATQQPVAGDLRLLFATSKICGHLERVGDHAKKLAKISLALDELPPTEVPASLLDMTEIAQTMVRMCLDALAQGDRKLAREVIARDDAMDALDRQVLEEMIAWMGREQRVVRRGVEFILAARHLERMGDEASNVAEEVVFLVEGRVIRHCAPDAQAPSDC